MIFRVEASACCEETDKALLAVEDWDGDEWNGSGVLLPSELKIHRIVADDTLTGKEICEGIMFLVHWKGDPNGGKPTFTLSGHVEAESPDEVLQKIEEFEIVLITGN